MTFYSRISKVSQKPEFLSSPCDPPLSPLSFLFQDDEKFLTDLFAQLTDEATDDDKRHELVCRRSLEIFYRVLW